MIQTETLPTTGLYVYAFVRTEDCKQLELTNIKGLNDQSLQMISASGVSVIVSPISERKIRPQRKLLAAHQDVVSTLAKSMSILPVSFGLIADNLDQVERVLSNYTDVLVEQLDRVAGQVEMSVSIRWTVPNIFQCFVERHEELRYFRDQVASGAASRDEQIEAGRTFERLLSSERNEYGRIVLDVLAPYCKEIDVQPAKIESDVVRLACLVQRDSVEEFSAAVYRAAEKFNEDFAFSFNGPWPPYSFVKLSLSLEG